MMKRDSFVGIDIGGTKVNIGIIDENGNIITIRKMATGVGPLSSEETVLNIIEAADQTIEGLSRDYKINSIGIGVPGTVDRREGMVMFAPNLNWVNVPVKEMFYKHFKKPVFIGQDTEAAALGEYVFGAGACFRDIVCITIGTGIGCGIILEGKIYKGVFGTAGEFGHIIVEKDGNICNCGKKGCLEAYSSGTGILNTFKRRAAKGEKTSLINRMRLEDIRTEDIFQEAKNQDVLSTDIIKNAVEYLSIGITNLVNILGPQAVIFSGGISSEDEFFIRPLMESIDKRIYTLLKGKLKILRAGLGENAPLIGAAILYRDPLYHTGR